MASRLYVSVVLAILELMALSREPSLNTHGAGCCLPGEESTSSTYANGKRSKAEIVRPDQN